MHVFIHTIVTIQIIIQTMKNKNETEETLSLLLSEKVYKTTVYSSCGLAVIFFSHYFIKKYR